MERLFEAASHLEPDARRHFLDAACNDDPQLRDELASLLRAEHAAGGFLDDLVPDDSVPDDSASDAFDTFAPGRKIGPYELLTRVGEGGMGEVFLARRADGRFHKRFAIKVVPLMMASDDHLSAFRAERHILASLDHPNIARLYDAGTTRGLPYLVMEYVEGEPIDTHCNRHGHSITERLALFRVVCAAVHHAHQNLIVHRDLKPSNILVTGEGVPKLLDFGIAKLLNPALANASFKPEADRHLTPEYASPEQRMDKAITTSSDVYSLGVLLYVLLTGRLPHPVAGPSTDVIKSVARSESPPPPSAVALANAGGEQPVRPIPSDLDHICLKALAKEPQRRYASAEQLSEDVDRFLTGYPVRARHRSWGYRLIKLARRRVVAVATAAFVLALIVTATTMLAIRSSQLARERDDARYERDKGQQVLRFVETVFKRPDLGGGPRRDTSARDVLQREAARVRTSFRGPPEVKASIMNLLGNMHRDLGLDDEAEALLSEALTIREERLDPDHADVAESLNDLALHGMDQARFAEAKVLLDRALDIRERAFGGAHPEVAETVNNIGLVHQNQGDYETAKSFFQQGLTLNLEAFGRDHNYVALSFNNLATSLVQLGDYAGAESAFRDALEIQERVLEQPHQQHARTLGNLAQVLRLTGRLDEAEAQFRRALVMHREIATEENADVALAIHNVGAVLVEKGAYREAEEYLVVAVRLWEKRYGRTYLRNGLTLHDLGRAVLGNNDLPRAEILFREASDILEASLPEAHHLRAHPLVGLGRVFLRAEEPDAAYRVLRQAVDIERRALPAGHLDIADAELLLGESLMALGKLNEAEAYFLSSDRVFRANSVLRPRQRQRVLEHLVRVNEALGRNEAAARYRTQLDNATLRMPDSPRFDSRNRQR